MMKTPTILGGMIASVALCANGQGFVNFDFEQATVGGINGVKPGQLTIGASWDGCRTTRGVRIQVPNGWFPVISRTNSGETL
jgi:hypothetical protein